MIKIYQYILLLITIFYSVLSYSFENSKNKSLDSLYIYINKLEDDTIKALKLTDLSHQYLKFQLDTALLLGQRSFELSTELDYEYGIAKSLFQLGLVLRYQGNYDKAIEHSLTSFEIFNRLNKPFEKARVLNSLGNVYKRKGNFDKSLQSFHQGLKIFQELKDSSLISSVINNIAILYFEMSHLDKALEYQFQNLEIKKKLKLDDKIPIVLMNIGNIYKSKKNYELALDYYKEALDLIPMSVNNYDKLLLLHNIGVIYQKKRRYYEADNYYRKALHLEQEIGERSLRIYTLQGIGNVLIETGKFSEGEKYLIESFQLAKEIGDLPKQSNVALNLQKAYERQNHYKQSLKYLKLYNEIQNSIFNEDYIKQVTSLEQKYEAEKREQQIAFLEKEQVIQKLKLSKREIETKQKSFQRNILILVSVLAILLLVYYFNDNKKRKKLNQILIKQNNKITDQRIEIAKQNDELIESNKTKDRLFQIIAHDLRSPLVSMDSIAQLIPYWVEEQDYKSLKKLSKTLELSVNNVLSLIDSLLNWALNQQGKFPYKPENLNLKENILETIEVYRPIAEIKNIDLKFTFSKDAMVFADRNMLFTVMRNLLNNAVKFTPEKGKIIVGIDSNQQFAKVWVKDSGIGIPKEKRKMVFELTNGHGKGTNGETGKGLGLFFCKEFVTMNNGDIFIESAKGEGTTITFTLPLFNMPEN